jgi:hypothetical protein
MRFKAIVCEVKFEVVLGRKCLWVDDGGLEAGRRRLFMCQSKWNAREKNRRFSRQRDERREHKKMESIPEGYQELTDAKEKVFAVVMVKTVVVVLEEI